MDDTKEGILLIWTTMIILLAFVLSLLAVMIIYRKRRLDHNREIDRMNERFTRELLKAQMEMQQLTMQHIGMEIHDDVGQKLVLAALYLQQLPFEDDRIEKKINSVSSIINESLADLRNLSKSLTAGSNLEGDLYQLIQTECNRVQIAGTCRVSLDSESISPQASQPIKNFVLRILQEFLQNSLKHANCANIRVRLQLEAGNLLIFASDDGKGFSPADQGYNNGIGLKNMKKRAEMIGAAFSLDSSPGQGTSMQLQIPAEKLNE
jgi:signal transduction histidine kinase